MAQAAARQLVDEGLERGVGAVDRDHGGVDPLVAFLPGFAQRGDAWDASGGAGARNATGALR